MKDIDMNDIEKQRECIFEAQDLLIAAEKKLRKHYDCLVSLSALVQTCDDAELVADGRVTALEALTAVEVHHSNSLNLLKRLNEEIAGETTRRR